MRLWDVFSHLTHNSLKLQEKFFEILAFSDGNPSVGGNFRRHGAYVKRVETKRL